ncbi:3D domain-containing protein [Brevibacillus fulvus]|uniref:Uncharacterized protein YabE (DUF348 family)/3D (Asp-Asp-Asp) domain-containing protein n=1 Tax=Brevibacillus fulvus TaxID=1125967 RepID=A0A938Y2F4_9BACL|nr:3D domain-containing protein [Brevibacillus fulvus]MBM7592061.1 uncharacterized protein YabE (DUF348 family)/3D (Asp-Asp-Asp) domain-containing protein [Brevibacillus fulvus]
MELSKIWMTHKRLLIVAACGLALLLLSVVSCLSILTTQPKQVTLNLDGVTKQFQTEANTVGEFLSEQKIPVNETDVLNPKPETKLTDALVIELHTSWEVAVQVDGQTKKVHTRSKDVAGVLRDAGITLGANDKVEPALTSTVSKDTKISITRIAEKVVQVTQEVPFQEIRKSDPTLTKGETRILQNGQPGKAVLHYKLQMANGKEIARELVKTEVITPKSDKIIAVGAAPAVAASKTAVTAKQVVAAAGIVSRGGKVFRPKRVLNNVTLTAYTPAGGGKSPNSPGYGRTATGVKAVEGRTIAVDPDVIPLGWWVYIEGIGFRHAEDTGGSVNGNKIDVFFDNHAEAVQFGRKRSKTVYIIGPQKPD